METFAFWLLTGGQLTMPGWTHLDVDEIRAETEKAFLLVIDGEEKWVPKSVVADAHDYAKGDIDAVVSVTDWWAEKEGLA